MRTGSWICLTIFLTVLALLLLVAGYIAPMWIWLEKDAFLVGVGLWYSIGCGRDGTCGAGVTAPTLDFGYSPDDTYKKAEYKAVQGLLTVGLAAGILLLLFLIVYKLGYSRWTRMDQLNLTAFLTCIITWLCVLAGLIVYCAFYWAVVGTSTIKMGNRESFPWSLVMCWFSALLFIVVTVLIRLKCRDRNYLKHAIPTSGDSKMDLNPVTKQGLLHRYFTPFHYNENRRMHFGGSQPDEGTLVPGMNKHLLGAEVRQSYGTDNMGLNANRLESGVGYRYHGSQQGDVTTTNTNANTSNELIHRRTLPSAVLTYNDNTAASTRDNRALVRSFSTGSMGRDGMVQGQTTTAAVQRRHVRQNSADQAMFTGRGGYQDAAFQGAAYAGYSAGGIGQNITGYEEVVTREVINRHSSGGGGGGRGGNVIPDIVLNRSSSLSRPDAGGMVRGAEGGYVTYQRVTRQPVVTSGTTYVTRETTRGGGGLTVDNDDFDRWTDDGRHVANMDYATMLQNRRSGMAMSQAGSGASSRGRYTTHTTAPVTNTSLNLGLGTSIATRNTGSLFPLGSTVKEYDPTYIYRPFSGQQKY